MSKPRQPILPTSHDGIYPRCPWCGGENYGPAVIDYSKGKAPCWQCGEYLPKAYVKLEAKG